MTEATNLGLAFAYPSPPTHYSISDINLSSLGSLYDFTSMPPSPPQQSPEGSGSQERGPLSSLNLGFLKALNDKKPTRDGNPPKRRGPKPDSKPALTRRQELNRQAQRYVDLAPLLVQPLVLMIIAELIVNGRSYTSKLWRMR